MVRAIVTNAAGERMLVLGLSKENLRRLEKGYPIRFDPTLFVQEKLARMILVFGETEAEIVEQLRVTVERVAADPGNDGRLRVDPGNDGL